MRTRFVYPNFSGVMFVVVALFSLSLLGHARVSAATMEEVDGEIKKANEALKTANEVKESAKDRAKTLSIAIDQLHGACDMVEKVPGLSPDDRDKKTTEIMSMIFWCTKMMPLDLSGGAIVLAKAETAAGGNGAGGGAPAAVKDKGPDLDEVLFNRAKEFSAAHPLDLDGIVTHFENIATSYPGTKWGQQSAAEAKTARTKLEAERHAQQPLMQRVEKMELAAVLETVTKQLATETDPVKKTELTDTKTDVEAVQGIFDKYLHFLTTRATPLSVAFEDIGLNRKGWIKSADAAGVSYADKADADAGSAQLKWDAVGAKATMRLINKTLAITDPDTLAQLAIAATACEEYIVAHDCFSRILNIAPGKTKELMGYFIRSQYGYSTSGEAAARTRFNEAKTLFKNRKFKEGLAALSDLQKDLAETSSLAVMLKEVNRFRVLSCRQAQIDDAGNPISPFERAIRGSFQGDVKIDEATGDVEANYDFATPEQFRDWIQTEQYPRPSSRVDWMLQDGKLVSSGLGLMLAWRFPLVHFQATADISFQDATKRVLMYSCLTKDKPIGIWGWCHDGEAKIGKAPKVSAEGWYSSSRFIWRPNEVAKLLWYYNPDSEYPSGIYVNGKYGVNGKEPYTVGGIGFGFEGNGKGSITNIHIKGKLDIAALKALLASPSGP